MTNPYYHQYAQVQTATVTQEQLLLMLYEGAIKFLGRAKEELSMGHLGPGKTALSKALAIISELQNSLDAESSWEGKDNLFHLYGHMILEITEVNLKGDLNRIDGVRGLLTALYDTWKEAIVSLSPQSATGAVAPPAERGPFKATI